MRHRNSQGQFTKGFPALSREKHPQWKGDNVGYASLHEWIKNRKPKPKYCEECGKETNWLDLANISQEYKRKLNDWEYICRRCHMIKDGRLEKLVDCDKGIKYRCDGCGSFVVRGSLCNKCGKQHEDPCLNAIFPQCNGANGCDTCEHQPEV